MTPRVADTQASIERTTSPHLTSPLEDTMSTITFDHIQRPAAPALRLTRRGKLVVIATALIVLAFLAMVFSSSVVATDQAGSVDDTTTVTVSAGETLWQIAAEANPEGDIRDTIDEIVELNSLPGATVQPGTEIAVPIY